MFDPYLNNKKLRFEDRGLHYHEIVIYEITI